MKPSAHSRDEYKECETYTHHSQTAESQKQGNFWKYPKIRGLGSMGGRCIIKKRNNKINKWIFNRHEESEKATIWHL